MIFLQLKVLGWRKKETVQPKSWFSRLKSLLSLTAHTRQPGDNVDSFGGGDEETFAGVDSFAYDEDTFGDDNNRIEDLVMAPWLNNRPLPWNIQTE